MRIDTIKKIESVILCKLNKNPIGELPTSCITSCEKIFDEISEIEIEVNKYTIRQSDKKKIENPLYYEIKNKRYLLINDKDYYIIDKVNESKLLGVKTATCYSGEKILARFPIDMEDFYLQLLTDDIENNIYSLKTILKEIGWTLNHVDDSIAYEKDSNKEKLRLQESISGNILDFIKEDIANQFECYPVFNPKDRTVSLYDLNEFGEDIQLCLTKDNYLKSKSVEKDSEDLITVLKLRGADELDVSRYIVGGYDFITNFSYFIEIQEMSDELIEALNKYDEVVEIRHEEWLSLTDEKNNKEKELSIKRNEWTISSSTVNCLRDITNRHKLNNDSVNEALSKVKWNKEKDKEQLLRIEIDVLLNEIERLENEINTLNLLCKYETATDVEGNLIFNEDLLNELQEFIFIDTYENDSFVDANSLINKGRQVLETRCKPTSQIDIDSINFLNRIVDNGFRLKWNGELSFGDIIILIDEDTQQEEFYYFIGYSPDYKNNKLNLKISNKKSNRDNAKTINTWLKESKKTKSLLTRNKYLFNKIKGNRLNIDRGDM